MLVYIFSPQVNDVDIQWDFTGIGNLADAPMFSSRLNEVQLTVLLPETAILNWVPPIP